MKKFLLAVLIISGITACNSPQEITTGADSANSVSATRPDSMLMRKDTMMQGDTLKRDTMR